VEKQNSADKLIVVDVLIAMAELSPMPRTLTE
jgi:hypothetical protein